MTETKRTMRRWEDMRTDALVEIFTELNLIQLIHVSQVCRLWRLACSDPFLWNTLDFGLLKSRFMRTQFSPYILVAESFDRELTNLLRNAMALSCGHISCLIFHFDLYMKDEHFSYVSERTHNLKRLILPAWKRITKPGIIRRWQELESLTMPTIAHPRYIMKEMSKNCKNLCSLKVLGTVDWRFAITIASKLPVLKTLSVRCSILTNEALLLILDCMDHLEVLNISHCKLCENLTFLGRNQVYTELSSAIMEKASRLREFYYCMNLSSCATCKRMEKDAGIMRWSMYEDWFWRHDEVSSLVLGDNYGKLLGRELMQAAGRI